MTGSVAEIISDSDARKTIKWNWPENLTEEVGGREKINTHAV
jgi:hypothetical protein